MHVEVNLDALVGPTHHFGGVGVGNVASQAHKNQPSSPRLAALEGLRKAAQVASLGIPQYILPPLRRPLPDFLSQLGFAGDFTSQCQSACELLPAAYSAVFSSAYMWAANAATVTPSCDTRDGKMHLTLANLSSSWHRMSEHAERQQQLTHMLAGLGSEQVVVHDALPSMLPLRDEGAANHMRLCDATGRIGFNLFVYGESATSAKPANFVARQTREACEAIARLHQLDPDRTFYFQQHPAAIDAGVFHNDVIATSHRVLLLHHEAAFMGGASELERLCSTFRELTGSPLRVLSIKHDELSLTDAVQSYLFNSQLLSPANDPESMTLLCAAQCQRTPNVQQLIERIIKDPTNPVQAVHYASLDQSMSGGGGPACLRLRMTLPSDLLVRFAPQYRWTAALHERLEQAINRTYPDQLLWSDLGSSQNLESYAVAYAAIETIFRL